LFIGLHGSGISSLHCKTNNEKIINHGSNFTSLTAFQNEAKNQSDNLKNKKMEATEKSAIEKLIFSYQDALNASDVNRVIEL